ncbi:CooT family nickel-binding protein [Chloroflexota bacterium]
MSKAYIDRNGKRELLLEEVASVEISEGNLVMRTLFGERKEIEANLREINFVNNSIELENLIG